MIKRFVNFSEPCWFSIIIAFILVALGALLIFYASPLNRVFGIAIAAFGVWLLFNETFILRSCKK